MPSFENVIRFHFAHKGRCHIRIGNEQSVLVEQGDLVMVTRGAEHTLLCDKTTQEDALPLDKVVEDSGFTGSGTLVYGEVGADHETQLVCGHFAFDRFASHPLIDALPSHILVKNYGESAGHWMDSTLRIIGAEACRGQIGSDLIAFRLSEIIFAQTLRTHFVQTGASKPVFAALTEPNIVKALESIHADPGKHWTLEALSSIACMSRTSFATKFTHYMTMAPLQYITFWRMQIARQQLAQSSASIIDIAESVGYRSEAAFGRVFKKHYSSAPATYRRQLHGQG